MKIFLILLAFALLGNFDIAHAGIDDVPMTEPQPNLLNCYEQGAISVMDAGVLKADGKQDEAEDLYAQAYAYYMKGAALKDVIIEDDSIRALVLTNLGFLYIKGYGVAQDEAQAKIYWEEAVNLGGKAAKFNLTLLQKHNPKLFQ